MKKSIFAAWLIALAGLGGCAKIRYPNYYVLNVPKPASRAPESAPASGTVAVREFRAPQYLRQGPIVYRPQPEQIAFYAYDHWGDDPRQAVAAALIRELQAKAMFESAEPYDGRRTSDFVITGSLDHLEEVDNGKSVSVEVGLSARLQNVKTGEVVWSGSSFQTSKVDQRSIPGVVAEMSRNLSEAARQLVSSMQQQVPTRAVSNR